MIHATNYNILVGQLAFYPFHFGVDNWIEEVWTRPSCLVGDGRKELNVVAFAAAATIAPLSMVFGIGVIVDTLPYGLHYWGSVEDQWEMAPKGALCAIPRFLFLPVAIPPSYYGGVKTLFSFSILQHHSYVIPHQCWHIPFHGGLPDEGTTLVILFAGIRT